MSKLARTAMRVSIDVRSCSGITSLATETLSLIFALGTATRFGQPDAQYDATSFPIIVSHVCRYWRSVALSTSRLWSTIVVCGPFALSVTAKSDGERSQTTCLAEATCLQRIQAFLERSKSSPLTLYVDVRSPSWHFRPNEHDHPFTAEHMTMLLHYLLAHVDRWHDVEVISDSWVPLIAFLECWGYHRTSEEKRKAKALQRLALTISNAYYVLETAQSPSPGSKTLVHPFDTAPSLCCVTLSGVPIDWTNHFLHNLTELSLKYHSRDVLPTPVQLINIINSSPKLQDLSLHGWGCHSFAVDLSGLERRISIRSVKRLSIGWVNVQHFIPLLSLFDWQVPNLRNITLEDVTNSLDPLSEQNSSRILDYISTRILECESDRDPLSDPFELTLNSVRASFDSFRGLMVAFPLLRNLTLHNVDDALLYVLDPFQGTTKSGSLLCPKLIRVVIRTAGSIPVEELERMVQARDVIRASASPLASIPPINLEIENLLESDLATELIDDIFDEDIDAGLTENIFDSSSLDEFGSLYDETSGDESPICTPPPQDFSIDIGADNTFTGDDVFGTGVTEEPERLIVDCSSTFLPYYITNDPS